MAEKSERAKKEEKILQFWQENKIFEKTLRQTKNGKEFVFYDGPPFATGLPHYGHILPGTVKDVIPRYKTMRGYHVPRRWGWDCHGLPIENLVEKELGLETKKDIEKFGIGEFNKRARASVLTFEKDWKEIIPRTGRSIDMDNAYKTMDSSYTESVWWSFKTLYDKGLVYKGFKSMHLCPHCETTLANFEVNQGYKDITDISVYVRFEMVDEPRTFFLVWTTTPWTLPGNVAIAVNPELDYVKVKVEDEFLILAESRLASLKDKEYEIIDSYKGQDLLGKKYKTLFDYYLKEAQVYGADFVTSEEGTGIVHIAPGFGEDDYQLSLKEKLPLIQHVGTDGRFKLEVREFAGEPVKPRDDHQATDIKIIKYLAEKNLLFAKEKITHSYPHCWRCDTPLLNYAASSWFVKVTEIKDKLERNNEKVSWVPKDIRSGRFGKWLEGARDWAVSRSRFWGTPLPVWESADGSKKILVDSVETLRQYSKANNKYLVMRHGESKHNLTWSISTKAGGSDGLTEKGKEQVIHAAKELTGKGIDLLIISPFVRTRETAKIVQDALGLPDEAVIVNEALHEFGVYSFEGKTWKDYHESFPKTKEYYDKKREGDESFRDLKMRVMSVLTECEKKYKDKTILFITHGGPAWVMTAGSKFVSLDEMYAMIDRKEGSRLDDMKNAEFRSLNFLPLPHNEDYELDLHRPYIDEVVLEKDGEEYKRIPEVFDTWYDSGSVPFASRAARDSRPADFIAEGLDQTRGWFYTMLVLGTALFNESPYRRVVVNGLILAEDGKKMSKRLKNYPELTEVLDRFGADALRYYLVSSPAVHAEDLAFRESGLDEVVKKVINRLENVVSFYELYKNNLEPNTKNLTPVHALDRWIDAKLTKLVSEITKALENYELDKASRPIADFVEDLSTWYLRRSRNRPEALFKLRSVLIELAKLIAPFMPFLAEDIYSRLKGDKDKESVHLTDWPLAKRSIFSFFNSGSKKLLKDMEDTREIVSLALEVRQRANIKVRQPLKELRIKNQELGEEYLELIRDEVNVKEVVPDRRLDGEILLDTNLTTELMEEGKLRDLIRMVQEWRKENNLKPQDKVDYKFPEEDKEIFTKYKLEIENSTNITLI